MAAAKKEKKTTAKKKTPATAEAASAITQIKGYVISRKRSGRFEVRTAKGKQVNGADKTKLLLDAKLISAGTPKAAAAEEAPTT